MTDQQTEQADQQAEDSLGPAEWLTVPDVAERLDVPVTKVRQLLRERRLLAERRDGVLYVPAEFVSGGTDGTPGSLLKGLPGLLTLLFDARYTEEEAMLFLFRPDSSLPGTPVQALTENRSKEVHRRAQALAF